MTRTKGKSRIGRPPKHGAYSYITRGELPEKRRHIANYLTNIRESLIADLGPMEEDLTAAQLILIDRVVMKLGCVRLMEEHISETSVMKGNDLAPCLRSSYLAYNNSIRLDLVVLGIEQKQLDGPDIQQVMREFDEQKEKDQGKRADSRSKALSKGKQGIDS